MMQMIAGFWKACSIYNAARLDIADRLAEGPQTAEQLAAATGTLTPFLSRLLRALASVGVFSCDDAGAYSLTPVGNTLRSNVPGSMKAMAIAQMGDHFPAWGSLMHSLKTGGIAFDHVAGMPVWKYYETHPEDGANFAKAMSGLTEAAVAHIVPAYDFSQYSTIVDVGGGNGALLSGILGAARSSHGLVYDEAYLQDQAETNLEHQGLLSRCLFKGGSFFDSIPEGGDLYVMKMILHDWNDDQCRQILGNARQAMASDSKLLIIESVIPEGNEPHPGKFMDLNMMAMTGGRERTEKEWRELAAECGLSITRVIPTHHPLFSMIEVARS